MLLGITPTAPLEKYGYIVPKTENDISLVASFKEKPDKKNAQRYIKMALCGTPAFLCLNLATY